MTESHSLLKLIVACLVLIGILLVLGLLVGPLSFSTPPLATPATEFSVPQFTDATKEKLERHAFFDALVSYTETGFEPREIILAQGETLRVSNNAANALTLTDATPQGVYDSGACDIASLSTCAPIAPMDFWEFSFEKVGDWTLQSETGNVMVIHVR
jgi:hypothetical protein